MLQKPESSGENIYISILIQIPQFSLHTHHLSFIIKSVGNVVINEANRTTVWAVEAFKRQEHL